MSETVLAQLPLTQSQVLDQAAELVKAGSTPAEAAERVLAHHRLSTEAERYFLREGVRSAINLSKHQHVTSTVAAPMPEARQDRQTFARFQPRWAHGHDLQGALDAMFQGAHGRMKPLADFLREDWKELLHVEVGQVRGHAARVRVIQDALALLDRYSAETARGLSEEALKELEAAVAGAWRK